MITKTMEMYLEAIYELEKEYGSSSPTDIAKKRGVKIASVTYMLQRLKDKGLINYRRYRSITLTPKGMQLAEQLKKKHEAIKWFLVLIGVEEEIADADACELEHYVHSQTIERLTEFSDWVGDGSETPKWLLEFRKFQETGIRKQDMK
jgi:DtxR family Mn-dependent transcriptional regulator